MIFLAMYGLIVCLIKTYGGALFKRLTVISLVHRPGDFTPFAPNIAASDGFHPQTPSAQQTPTQVNPINPVTVVVPPPQTLQILNRQMFCPPAPTPVPTPTFQPCHYTRSNIGQAPNMLDPSDHLVTQHIDTTGYSSAPANTSPIEHYCNMICIKLPSLNYVQTASQGGSRRQVLRGP